MTREYGEIIFVFDTYKDVSLKYATREARLQGQSPVQYHIHDETRIKHITMKRFLSHDKTKADLADYLAMQVLSYNTDSPKLVITSSSGYTISNGSIEFEDNTHEEADTLMIHHAVLSSRRNPANARIVIEPIARALGRQRAKALPALHAFSGDTVGKCNQLGKATWMNIFMKSGSDTIGALEQLLTVNETSEQQLAVLASFECVQLTAQKALRLAAFLNSDGTCSANIWQRVTGFHRHREPSNSTFYVPISKQGYGDRPVSHNMSS